MCVRPRPVVVYRRITELMSSIFTLAKRLSVAALTSIAIAGAVVAPAEAVPTTAGCRAVPQPALTLGAEGIVRVEIPAAAGWHEVAAPRGASRLALGRLEDASGQDALDAWIGVLNSNTITTSAQFADAETAHRQVLSRRSVAGPCGLPTEAVTVRHAATATEREYFVSGRYTLAQANGKTLVIYVGASTYDRNRLPQLENDLLRGYGIRLPA